MSESSEKLNAWKDDFQAARPRYESFTADLEGLVRRILSDADIDPSQIEVRTKDVESFADKIERKNFKYNDPVNDITDLSGIRIIAYYLDDVARIGDIIEREFSVDWENSYRMDEGDPNYFGYRSDHFVVSLAPSRAKLSEWRTFKDCRAEIQVRTVMQHAWAAVDHKLRYKAETLPADIQRRLSRLSAMLEVADEQFSAVREDALSATSSYSESVRSGDLALELDILSLQAYLEERELAGYWTKRAIDAGFASSAHNDDPYKLLTTLLDAGFTKIKDVDELYAGAEVWGDRVLADLVAETSARDSSIYAAPIDVLNFLALVGNRRAKAVDSTRYISPIRAAIKAAIKNFLA